MPATRSITIEDRITVPGTAFDHAGYRTWVTSRSYPEGVRTTYVDGEVLVEMSPESIATHNKVKMAVTAALDATFANAISARSLPTACSSPMRRPV